MDGARRRDWRPSRRFARDRRANVAVMTALLLPVFLMIAAFAVDAGALYVERREAQATTDLAAIVAAANLGDAEEQALATMADNRQHGVILIDAATFETTPVDGATGKHLLVQRGRYVPDRALAPAERFAAGGTPANAVRVTLRKRGTLYFANGFAPAPLMTTSAVAATRTEAAFSVASRLASVNAGMLNAVLGALLGAEIDLVAMDYRALADTDVKVLGLLDVLAHELDLTAGTYEEVLAAEATIGTLMKVLSNVAGDRQAQLALEQIAAAQPGGLTVPLSQLLDLGPLGQLSVGQGDPPLDARLNVMALVGATAAVANRDNQVHVGLGAAPGGILGIALDIAIGEPPQGLPWFAIGEHGTTVRTAQTRLLLAVEVAGPGILGSHVRLPILIEIGHAEAKLVDLSCTGRRPTRIAIDAKPGVFEAWIGDIAAHELRRFDRKPLVRPAELVRLPTVKVTGSSRVASGNLAASRLTFDAREIEDHAVKTVSTHHITQSLVRSLLDELALEVDILGIGLGLPTSAVRSAMKQVLFNVAGRLDDTLDWLLATLGVRVGEADIRIKGASCRHAVLVR